jgi:hypothetical protein
MQGRAKSLTPRAISYGLICRLVLSALRAKPNIRGVNVGLRAPENGALNSTYKSYAIALA